MAVKKAGTVRTTAKKTPAPVARLVSGAFEEVFLVNLNRELANGYTVVGYGNDRGFMSALVIK
jgi:hypothetical protein